MAYEELGKEGQIRLLMAEGGVVISECKLSNGIALAPEQMQAQQEAYDQWTAPATGIVESESFLKKYELVPDAAPTDTSAQDDDAQAQQEKNTTREGILVRRGQIWEDLDTRQNQRRVVVEFIKSGRARVRAHYGTRRSTISVFRMHKHSRGFRLVEPGELKYGVPTASSDETAQR
ncbi:hypothetical protein [Streptomyces sp. NPDC002671]